MMSGISAALSGMNAAEARIAKAADNIANLEQRPEVSPEEEVAATITAKAQFQASAQVIKADKQTTDALLDILA